MAFNRKLAVEHLREKMASGNASVGTWIQIPHASVAEILGHAGYDWVALDLEHGTFGASLLPDCFRALELGGTLPLVRLAQGTPRECKQVLDAGAGGVIVPMIESAQQLEQVRDACRWPPAGTRGVGFSRANLFGKYFDDYTSEAQAPLLVAMIEHKRAVDELDAILAVDGLDAILVGPYDLSASLGKTAQFTDPEFVSVFEQIRSKANEKSIPCGVHVVNPSPEELQQRIDEGYRFLAYTIDALLLTRFAENPCLTSNPKSS